MRRSSASGFCSQNGSSGSCFSCPSLRSAFARLTSSTSSHAPPCTRRTSRPLRKPPSPSPLSSERHGHPKRERERDESRFPPCRLKQGKKWCERGRVRSKQAIPPMRNNVSQHILGRRTPTPLLIAIIIKDGQVRNHFYSQPCADAPLSLSLSLSLLLLIFKIFWETEKGKT